KGFLFVIARPEGESESAVASAKKQTGSPGESKSGGQPDKICDSLRRTEAMGKAFGGGVRPGPCAAASSRATAARSPPVGVSVDRTAHVSDNYSLEGRLRGTDMADELTQYLRGTSCDARCVCCRSC